MKHATDVACVSQGITVPPLARFKHFWTKNHPSLKVFAVLNLHAAEKKAATEGGKTMILLNRSSGYPGRAYVRRRFRSIGRWFFSLVNGWVAAFIARREYQATLAVLRGLSDRELRDMGIYHNQAGPALEDAARYRTSRQHPDT